MLAKKQKLSESEEDDEEDGYTRVTTFMNKYVFFAQLRKSLLDIRSCHFVCDLCSQLCRMKPSTNVVLQLIPRLTSALLFVLPRFKTAAATHHFANPMTVTPTLLPDLKFHQLVSDKKVAFCVLRSWVDCFKKRHQYLSNIGKGKEPTLECSLELLGITIVCRFMAMNLGLAHSAPSSLQNRL